MGEAAKHVLFEGFQAGCDVVLGGRRGTLSHYNLFDNVSKVSKVSKLEEVSHEMLALLFPRVSSRVSGFPVASPCLWGKLRNLSFSKVPKRVVMSFCVTGVALCDIPTCLITCRKFFVLYTLHFTLHTLHCTLHTPHSTLYPPHSTLYTPQHSALYTLHSPHSTLYTPHFTLHTLHFTFFTPHFTLHTPHSSLHTLHSTLHTLHFTLCTSHSTLHSTLYTLHSTLCTLHSTLSTLHSSQLVQPRYILTWELVKMHPSTRQRLFNSA